MNRHLLPILFLGLATLAAAQPAPAGVAAFTDTAAWRVHNRQVLPVPGRPDAVRLDERPKDGVLWLVGSNFGDGTIELDVRGADKPGQSFVGVAFRGVDDSTYDAVYFRPFNFRHAEAGRRAHSVQYISHPAHPWHRLREQHPGQYEATVSPVPDPNDWFHARIELRGSQIQVFVNGNPRPSLAVTALGDRPAGMIGLWVGAGSAGEFANLRLIPARD
jgi:hypothetical protein